MDVDSTAASSTTPTHIHVKEGTHVERAEDQDEAGECGVGGDSLEPVVVDVEEEHLRLRRPVGFDRVLVRPPCRDGTYLYGPLHAYPTPHAPNHTYRTNT